MRISVWSSDVCSSDLAAHVSLARAKVPGTGKLRALLMEPRGQLQVTGQRLQGVLPGAYGLGIAQRHRFVRRPGLEHVRNQPFRGEVPTAQYVTGPEIGRAHV